MTMREKMARDGYEAAIRQPLGDPSVRILTFNPGDPIHRWENQSDALRAVWFAVVDAHLDALLEPTEGMCDEMEVRCGKVASDGESWSTIIGKTVSSKARAKRGHKIQIGIALAKSRKISK